jgi:ATP-dependent RNA helicase SUPV3L1/SUV3
MLSILGATHEDMEAVLKGLGYRAEPKTESEVEGMRAKAAAAAPQPAPQPVAGAPSADTAAGGDEAPLVEAAADAPVQTSTDTIPAEAQQVGNDAPVQPADQPASETARAAEADIVTAPVTEGLAAEAANEAAAPETAHVEKTVLLWRPARADRSGPNRHQHRHGGNRQGNGAQGEGQARTGEGRERHGHGRPGGRKPDGRQEGGQRFDKRGDRNAKGRDGGHPFKGDRHKGKSGDFRKDKPGGAPMRQPERPIDPDSPFAKLLALKAQLEKPNG